MKTSLVVTTYNRRDALALTLESAVAQVQPPGEILVADDGSRPDTAEVVRAIAARSKIPIHHCWHEDRGFRLAAIRNRAIAQATGDYIILVDGDLVLDARFVADHARTARPGQWVQGGRVLLPEDVTRDALASGRLAFGPLLPRLGNRKNAIRSPLLSRLTSLFRTDVYRVRGANQAFWRADAVRVNGFNEEFEGWGREDSEFAARMLHAGIRRLHLQFSAIAFHLWHEERSREMLARNQEILETTLATRAARCVRGIDGHLGDAPGRASELRARVVPG